MRFEDDFLIRHLPHLSQAEDLKSSTVGQDRSLPVHETMQATHLGNDFRAGAQSQMIRVGQHHLSTGFT